MPQLVKKGQFLACPKTGRIIGMHSVRWRWLFPVIGFLALVWYLIRVLPKPSRAMYPCQRVAAPLASGFVSYLAGWLILVFGFRQLRINLRRADYWAVAVSILVMGIGLMLSLPPNRADAIGFVPAEGTNNPMGVARGIHPGRVVWTHAPEAARWDGSTGYWWQDACNNQPVIDKMVSETVRSLTDATTDGAAWEALFRHFNQTKGRGNVGYKPGEKIAIKLNLNNTETDRVGNPQELIDNQLDPSPHMVLALLRQLVNQANVPQECITIFDAVRYFPDIIFNKCKGAYPGLGGEFPNVVCLDKIGGRGRSQAQWTANTIHYSAANDCSPDIVSCLVDATYVINVALLKGHVYAGATLTAKNHYGSLFQSEYGFNRDHTYLISNQTSYAPLVDINGSRHIGGKTMLLMFDALYAAQTQGFVDEVAARDLPARFKNPPFNYGWTSSMFASQDPVAIDSVGLDFLSSEDGFIPQDSYTTRRPDNFLHEAAMAPNSPSGTVYTPDGAGFPLASLGVHEHWNNVTNRQYSRNLGRPNGIELVSVLVAPSQFLIDGSLDSTGYKLASNGANRLVAAVHGSTLYVAGPVPVYDDHVILVSDVLGAMGAAPAGKAGQVACNVVGKPYLTVRGGPKTVAWTNAGTSARCATANVVDGCFEGTLNLNEVFGQVPSKLYVALAPYGTGSGGTLRSWLQVPPSVNGDGNIEGNEFLEVPVTAILDGAFAGTFDAVDPQRGFGVRLTHSVGGDMLIWPSIPGHRYRVGTTTDLTQPFTILTNEMIAGPSQFQMIHTSSAPSGPRGRFYRIQHDSP